jgi:hypothetical protein
MNPSSGDSQAISEVTLTSDVYSVLKGRELYGRSHDKVRVVADHGTVLLVEGPAWKTEGGKTKLFIKSGLHRYQVAKEQVQ